MSIPYELTYPQKQALIEDGYVVIKGALSQATVERALRMINARMGQGISDEEIAGSPAGGYFKEISRNEPFENLLPGEVMRGLTESALGQGNVGHFGGAQIALRFPSMNEARKKPAAHLDGLHTKNNGVPEGELYSFTALIGTFLSPTTEPNTGNFSVRPGGHRVVAQWFKEHDYLEIDGALPPILDELADPKPVIAEAGDAVIANHLLPHGVTPNTGPNVRYAVFNRVKHVDHEQRKFDVLTDPWLHWEGLGDDRPEAHTSTEKREPVTVR